MNVALLNIRILFQKNAVIKDAIGNHKNTWSDYYECAATIGSESGSEVNKAGLTTESAYLSFTVRYAKETLAITTTGYRILFDGELYDIVAIDHMNFKKKSIKFWCEKARRQNG